MGFWDFTWRYGAGFFPLYGLYMMGLRFRVVRAQVLRLVFSGANVVLLGYLVYLGASSGGVGLLRSVTHVFGAMFTVLGSVYVVLLVASRASDQVSTTNE
jgi:hypothetical protein